MRLLLTSTLLASVVFPAHLVLAQTASDPSSVAQTNASAVTDTRYSGSLFAANTTPELRGSETTEATATSVPSTVPSGRTIYPVRPVAPARPVTPLRPVDPTQGAGHGAYEQPDPFKADGWRIGSFLFYPAITFYFDATDNIDDESKGRKGLYGRLVAEAEIQSDWDRHSLNIGSEIELRGYQEPARKRELEHSLDGELRLDLADQTTLTLDGSVQKKEEAANSVELLASGGTKSTQTNLKAGAVLEQGAGILKLQLRGSAEREEYDEDAARNFDTYIVGGRLGVELTDQVIPFVDVELSRKEAASGAVDLNGDSLRGAIGIEVVNREKLSGEASAGVITWRPKSSSQKDDAVFFADASLTWSPSALWSLKGGVETSLTSTSTSATSVATHTFSLSADYEARRNLKLGASASLGRETYRGSSRRDWVFDASLSAEYAINRHTQIVGKFTHERRNSTQSGSGYNSNLIEFGLRFQQ